MWPVRVAPAIAVRVPKAVETPAAFGPAPLPPATAPVKEPEPPAPLPLLPSSVKYSCGYNPFLPPGGEKNLTAFERRPLPDFRQALLAGSPQPSEEPAGPSGPLVRPRPTGGSPVSSFG